MDGSKLIEDKFLAMKLGTVYSLKREKRYDEAEKILNRLLAEFGDNFRIKLNMADVLLKQNRLSHALVLIDEVLKASPQDAEAMGIKGLIYYKKRLYQEAREWFQGAIQQKHSPFFFQMLIKSMVKTHELKKAICLVEDALKKKGDGAGQLLQLKAEIMEALGKKPEALEIYEYILAQRPGDKFISKEVIRIKTQKMDGAKAAKEINTLLKVSSYSKNEHLYIQQAENYKKEKRYEEAIEAYKNGLTVSPTNIFIKKQIGFCYARLKRYEEAIPYMKEAFLEEPSDFILRKSLFAAYKKLDRRKEIFDLIDDLGISGTRFYYALLGEAKR